MSGRGLDSSDNSVAEIPGSAGVILSTISAELFSVSASASTSIFLSVVTQWVVFGGIIVSADVRVLFNIECFFNMLLRGGKGGIEFEGRDCNDSITLGFGNVRST